MPNTKMMAGSPDVWFASSDGSGDLSLTIKSLLLAIVPLAVSLVKVYGYNIDENDIVAFINNAFTLVSVAGILVGLGRKIWYRFRAA